MKAKSSGDLALMLQAIIDTAIDGIITISARGKIEQINKAAAELFQYSPEEVIGNNVKMLMPEPYHSEHDGYLDNYQRTRKAKIIGIGREVTGKKKDGAHFPFRLAVSEVILNDRVVYNGIIHDLSDIKSAEQNLLKLNEELEETVEKRTNELEEVVNQLLVTNKKLIESEEVLSSALKKEKDLGELKSRFVSMASHEFRTPLSTILSSTSLIGKYTKQEQNEKREKHVNRIKSAVTNLTGILNDFLSLGKLEEGKVNVVSSEVNVVKLINQVIEELAGLLKPGQTFENQIKDKTLVIYTDARVLKNILFNLLSNAVKYSKDKIVCRVVVENGHLEFQVKDNGLGIPKEEQKYMFDRFFRASNVETIQGTGLGLNIAKRYTELLNGTIHFESKENEGTTFFVKMPRKYEKDSSH